MTSSGTSSNVVDGVGSCCAIPFSFNQMASWPLFPLLETDLLGGILKTRRHYYECRWCVVCAGI